MLFVHPHVQSLKIADPGGGMRDFVDGNRLTARRPTRKERHEAKKQERR
jgi:hypothetical protein